MTVTRIAASAITLIALFAGFDTPVDAQRAGRKPAPQAKRAAPQPKATPAPRREIAVPFAVGETLTYDVSWSSYVTAGTAVTTVKEKRGSGGSTAYYILAEGRPTPMLSKLYALYYKMDTLLDAHTLLPQYGSVYSEEGTRHRFGTTRFDRAARRAYFEHQTTTHVKNDFPVSPDTQDALSAIYVLRAIGLKPGDRLTIPLTNDGWVLKVLVEVAAAERVRTPFGEVSALRITPTITQANGQKFGRNLMMWISDDPRRLPVKIQAELPVGTFNLLLREAK